MTSVKTSTNRATTAPPAKTAAARAATAAPGAAAPKARVRGPAKAAVPPDSGPARPKSKLVRDSFTIPKAEYAVLDALKLRAARLMRPTKKSEVLRAGIAALNAMSDKAFLAVINGVPSLKTGRPKAAPASTKPPAK